MNNQRLFSLDYLRALACFLVILIHSPHSGDNANSFIMASATLFGLPCNGLFFMLSGYLLLPVREETHSFLKKRFTKILYPTLFWTFIYICLNVFQGKMQCGEFVRVVLSIPFSKQGLGWLWFMYVLMGLYLVAPVISSWIKDVSKSEFRFYIFLCVITSFFPLLKNWLIISEGVDNILYYFMGYISYFLLGAYLRKYPPLQYTPYSYFVWICMYLFPLIVALIARIFVIEVITLEFTSYLSFLTISMCIGLFCLFVKCEKMFQSHGWLSLFISGFSKYCYGIYLIQFIVSHYVLDKEFLLQEYGSFLQIVITSFLTLFLSYAIVWCVSWLPFSGYVIGFSRMREIKVNTK